MFEVFLHAMPVTGATGGLLIGLAAALMLRGAGRIAGVSGLAARAVSLTKGDVPVPLALAFAIRLPAGMGQFHHGDRSSPSSQQPSHG